MFHIKDMLYILNITKKKKDLFPSPFHNNLCVKDYYTVGVVGTNVPLTLTAAMNESFSITVSPLTS